MNAWSRAGDFWFMTAPPIGRQDPKAPRGWPWHARPSSRPDRQARPCQGCGSPPPALHGPVPTRSEHGSVVARREPLPMGSQVERFSKSTSSLVYVLTLPVEIRIAQRGGFGKLFRENFEKFLGVAILGPNRDFGIRVLQRRVLRRRIMRHVAERNVSQCDSEAECNM